MWYQFKVSGKDNLRFILKIFELCARDQINCNSILQDEFVAHPLIKTKQNESPHTPWQENWVESQLAVPLDSGSAFAKESRETGPPDALRARRLGCGCQPKIQSVFLGDDSLEDMDLVLWKCAGMSHTLVFSYGDKRARNSCQLNNMWRFEEDICGMIHDVLDSAEPWFVIQVISRGSGAEAGQDFTRLILNWRDDINIPWYQELNIFRSLKQFRLTGIASLLNVFSLGGRNVHSCEAVRSIKNLEAFFQDGNTRISFAN